MMAYISTHPGPCCESCIDDVAFDPEYGIWDDEGNTICCCAELRWQDEVKHQ